VCVEPAFQAVAMRRRRAVPVLNAAYVGANVALTIGLLATLLRRRDPRYRSLRTSVAGSMLAAQAPFLVFPTAPPRRLDGFVDTIRDVSSVDLDGGAVSCLFNPVAAMPSIHMAWAVVSAEALRACSRRRGARAAAAVYPPAVAATVLATGNHFVADVAAGAALGWGALRVTRRQTHSSG
jgi:hypothetical protein